MTAGSRYVGGINAVREALRSESPPQKVMLRDDAGPRHREILDLARGRRVPVTMVPQRKLDEAFRDGNQGVVALLADVRSLDLDDLEPGPDVLVVAVDGVTDPMNLGAILRSAEAAGAAAVLLPRRRTATLGPTVERASAGALAHLPVVSVGSLADALLRLGRRGFTVAGLDPSGDAIDAASGRISWPVVLVLGEEGGGLHHLVKERCDVRLAIPMRGRVASLNVSVAAGIALFELRRGRGR